MDDDRSRRLYEELGVKPVINCTRGHMTFLGGSILSPEVVQAMAQANRYFVNMKDLLEQTGRVVAGLIGCEAAYVTPGCCAALALGMAACIAGDDVEKLERIPDVTGMKHEVIVQKSLRSKYDRCVTVAGARLIEVGDEKGTTPQQMEVAIGDRTVAIHYLAPSRRNGPLSLEEVIQIAKRHGLPVIVDASGQVYPLENMRSYTAMGVDLVGFGGKYFGGPNSTGLLCGRKDLVEAAALHSFIGFEARTYRAIGRPMKLDRQEIIAVVHALRTWMTMDHQARFATYQRQVAELQGKLKGIPGLQMSPQGTPVSGLAVQLDERALGKTAAQVANDLREGSPAILVNTEADTIGISMVTICDGDIPVIAERLEQALRQ